MIESLGFCAFTPSLHYLLFCLFFFYTLLHTPNIQFHLFVFLALQSFFFNSLIYIYIKKIFYTNMNSKKNYSILSHHYFHVNNLCIDILFCFLCTCRCYMTRSENSLRANLFSFFFIILLFYFLISLFTIERIKKQFNRIRRENRTVFILSKV